MSNDAKLILGAVDLMGRTGSTARAFEALGDDGSWGAPQPIDVTLKSLLQDGSVVVTQGYDNREVSLRVRITADDADELANAEADLFAEIGKRNTLTWVPPDGWAPPSVFEVLTSRLEHVWDDLAELRNQRSYGITLTCEPFARSASLFVVSGAVNEAPDTPPPPPVVLNDGTSATGWTYSAIPTAAGSENLGFSVNPILKYAYQKSGVVTNHWYEYALSASVGGQKYLALDWRIEGPGAYAWGDPVATVNNPAGSALGGATLVRVGQIASPDFPGYNRTVWAVPADVASLSRLRFDMALNATNAKTTTYYQRGFSVRQVGLSSASLSSGTTRQKTMSLAVPGSAPTVGSLQVSHPSTALGDLLIYSWRDDGCGYAPPMRQFRRSGGTVTTDAALYSGASDLLNTDLVYRVPASQVPAGLYVLYARLKRATSGTSAIKTWADTIASDGATFLPTGGTTVTQTLTLTTSWKIVPLGRLMLPTVESPAGFVQLLLSDEGDTGVSIDELYLCNATIGRTTLVSAGSLGTTPTVGGAPSTVWVNSPTTDKPYGSIMGGVAADGSDSYNMRGLVSADQPHRWVPPTVAVFTACAALDATTTLSGYAHWHTHAGTADGAA